MRGDTAVSVTTPWVFALHWVLHVVLTCACFVGISCQRKGGEKVEFFFSTKMSEYMLYGNKTCPSRPSPPDGPHGERVIIWPI